MIYNLLYRLCTFCIPQANGIVITNNYRLVVFRYWIVSWLCNKDSADVSLSLVTLNHKIKQIPYYNIKFIEYKEWSLYFPKSFTLFF